VLPTLSIGDVSIIEGDGGTTKTAYLAVTLSDPSVFSVTVKFATSDGSASSAADYIPKTGMLTFTPGQTEKVIGVKVVGDLDLEGDEEFFATLDQPVAATIEAGHRGRAWGGHRQRNGLWGWRTGSGRGVRRRQPREWGRLLEHLHLVACNK